MNKIITISQRYKYIPTQKFKKEAGKLKSDVSGVVKKEVDHLFEINSGNIQFN